MKILHTSDWHLGRTWKGMTRYDEIRAVLDQLVSVVKNEKIDFVLHSGDLYDRKSPSAEAEDIAFKFFLSVHMAGAQSVVIAGNHDSPGAFDAQNRLTSLANTYLIGRPRAASNGGVITLRTRDGESLVVAALPFASPGMFVSAMDLTDDEAQVRTNYAHKFQLAAKNLCGEFKDESVNVFMAHTHLEGAVLSQSEKRVHVGEQWAGASQDLPPNASYIALGHIHQPQKIDGLVPAYYAGSPLQLDFGEIGQDKTFNVIEVKAGKPAKVDLVPYKGAYNLCDWEGTWAELQSDIENLSKKGWLRILLHLDQRDIEISRKVKELLPNTVTVLPPIVPQESSPDSTRPSKEAHPIEHFKDYYNNRHGSPPEKNIQDSFVRLYEEAQESLS